jgi:uncharacterized repeat protein (TIGR03803 family)
MPFPLALLFVALLSVAGIRAEVLTTIAHFDGTNGVMPTSSLSKGIDGNFYGVTDLGGQFGPGVVYRVTPGGVITAIAHFNEAESFFQDGVGSHLLAAQVSLLCGRHQGELRIGRWKSCPIQDGFGRVENLFCRIPLGRQRGSQLFRPLARGP